jgi:hypothetical protein
MHIFCTKVTLTLVFVFAGLLALSISAHTLDSTKRCQIVFPNMQISTATWDPLLMKLF